MKCSNCGIEGHKELTGITGVELDNIYTNGEKIIWFNSFSDARGYCADCMNSNNSMKK